MARIYEILPLASPHCGGEMEIIAFITETDFDQTPFQESEQAEPVSEFE